jgi:hypothetical protein
MRIGLGTEIRGDMLLASPTCFESVFAYNVIGLRRNPLGSIEVREYSRFSLSNEEAEAYEKCTFTRMSSAMPGTT